MYLLYHIMFTVNSAKINKIFPQTLSILIIDVYCQQCYNIITVRNSPVGTKERLMKMTTILLIPIKLLAKAVLYLIAAVVGVIGVIALFRLALRKQAAIYL